MNSLSFVNQLEMVKEQYRNKELTIIEEKFSS